MSLDDILEKMVHAMENNNYWDAESYAEMGLKKLKSSKVNKKHSEKIKGYLLTVVKKAKEAIKKQKEEKEFKEKLIDEIVNFKG